MLVTVMAILLTNVHYLFTLASGANIQKMSPTSEFSHRYPRIFTNITASPIYEYITLRTSV